MGATEQDQETDLRTQTTQLGAVNFSWVSPDLPAAIRSNQCPTDPDLVRLVSVNVDV